VKPTILSNEEVSDARPTIHQKSEHAETSSAMAARL